MYTDGMPDIQGMVDNGEPIYVINRSARVLGTAHLLVLEFPHPTNSRGSTVKIPPVQYPINLSSRVAPPSAIPLSTAFINWVHQGVLEIVPAERATEILKDPDARAAIDAAYRKLQNRRGDALRRREDPNFRVRQGGDRETHAVADLDESGLTAADFYGNKPDAWNADKELSQKAPIRKPQEQKPLQVQAETIKINPKIENFCQDLLEDPSLKGDYLVELKGWDDEMITDDELGYMLQQLSKFENICAYLRTVKAKRVGGSAEAEEGSRKRKKRSRLADLDEDEI